MRVPVLLGALALLTSSCAHTWQKKVEATPEQKLELYTTTATYLYEDDELLRAQEQAVKALEIDPDHRAMRRMIGWIRVRLGTNDDLIVSERFFRDLKREGDDNDATLLGLATVTERMGSAYDAVSRELAAGRREPQKKTAEREARDLAEKARDYWHESKGLYTKVWEDGGSTPAMNGLQRVTALLGEYDASLEWSDRLLERSTAELASWRRMLTSSQLTEREEDTFRENERIALDLQVDTHLFAGTLLFRLGRFEEVVGHLDEVVLARPQMAQAYSLRAQMLVRLEQWERALADIDRFLALSDRDFEHPEVKRAFELRMKAEAGLAGRAAPRTADQNG